MGGTPLTPAARISALSIVGDLLRKVGVRPAPPPPGPAWRLSHLQGVCEAQPCQLLPLKRRLGILAVALGLSHLLDSMLLWASALTDTQSPDSKSPL